MKPRVHEAPWQERVSMIGSSCLPIMIQSGTVQMESRLKLIRFRYTNNELDLSTGSIRHRAECDTNKLRQEG